MKTKEYWAALIADPGDEYTSFEAIVEAIQKDAFLAGQRAGLEEAVQILREASANPEDIRSGNPNS